MRITLHDGEIHGRDGSTTKLICKIGPGPGDWNCDGLKHVSARDANGDPDGVPRETLVFRDRGKIQELGYGDDVPLSFSFSVYQEAKISDAAIAKPADFFLKLGAFASANTVEIGGVVYTVDLYLNQTRASELIFLKNCDVSISFAEASDQGNTLSISGTCYGGYKLGKNV